MALCLDLEDYLVEDQDGGCVLMLESWTREAAEAFADIVKRSFPECGFRERRTGDRAGFLGLQQSLRLNGEFPEGGIDEVEGLLQLLTRSLTIEDSLDESHALAYHQEEDEATDKLRPSMLGKLVYEAKYRTRREPRERIGAALCRFIIAHPRYASADAIAAMPPHEASKSAGLPGRLVRQIVEELRIAQVDIVRLRTRAPQKEITDEDRQAGVRKRFQNQAGTMRVDQDMTGMNVIVIDDLYGSGASMMEAARALREAGADEVLGLTVTKQRLFGGVRLPARR